MSVCVKIYMLELLCGLWPKLMSVRLAVSKYLINELLNAVLAPPRFAYSPVTSNGVVSESLVCRMDLDKLYFIIVSKGESITGGWYCISRIGGMRILLEILPPINFRLSMDDLFETFISVGKIWRSNF